MHYNYFIILKLILIQFINVNYGNLKDNILIDSHIKLKNLSFNVQNIYTPNSIATQKTTIYNSSKIDSTDTAINRTT